METLPYRRLHDIASQKDRYIPKRSEFLRYADEYYMVESEAFLKLEEYFKKMFMKDIHAIAVEDDVHEDDVAFEIVANIWEEAYDHNVDFDDRNPTDIVNYTFEMLEREFDIVMPMDQANEFLRYLMDLVNSTRLWMNNGHTPNELLELSKPLSGPTTIVPGSSNAAKLLEEAAPKIKDMGFNVDLDSNVAEITTFTYK